MEGCWTWGIWLFPGQTTWSTARLVSFTIFFPNSKSAIDSNVLMLEQVLYLLMMEIVSPWDTKTVWTYSTKIWERLLHHTGQLTTRSFWNRTSIYHCTNNPSLCLKHQGVPGGSDVSGGSLYPLLGGYSDAKYRYLGTALDTIFIDSLFGERCCSFL